MEENEVAQGPEQFEKHRDLRRFDRLLFAYFIGIIAVSFYALMSHH